MAAPRRTSPQQGRLHATAILFFSNVQEFLGSAELWTDLRFLKSLMFRVQHSVKCVCVRVRDCVRAYMCVYVFPDDIF